MEDDLMEELSFGNNSNGSVKTFSSNVYTWYIDEVITTPVKYRDLISTLDFAGDNDIVRIHLNTPGGCLATTAAIVRAITQSRAKVVGIVDGQIASAGTILALSCDIVYFGDMCYAMFHTASYGTWGDTNKLSSHVDFSQDYIYNSLYYHYTGFLTEEEIEDMFHNSREIWMGAEELRSRWEAYVEYRNNLIVDTEDEEE